jgi:hypothetical protein
LNCGLSFSHWRNATFGISKRVNGHPEELSSFGRLRLGAIISDNYLDLATSDSADSPILAFELYDFKGALASCSFFFQLGIFFSFCFSLESYFFGEFVVVYFCLYDRIPIH